MFSRSTHPFHKVFRPIHTEKIDIALSKTNSDNWLNKNKVYQTFQPLLLDNNARMTDTSVVLWLFLDAFKLHSLHLSCICSCLKASAIVGIVSFSGSGGTGGVLSLYL